MQTRGYDEAPKQQTDRYTQMKKQFVKMAALAVMAVGALSAQASAANVSLSVNLANGQVKVGLSDNSCMHAHGKVKKHKVEHHKVAAKHKQKHHNARLVAARRDDHRKHRR